MLKVKWLTVKQIERQSQTKNGSHHGQNIKMSGVLEKEGKKRKQFLLSFSLDTKKNDNEKEKKDEISPVHCSRRQIF